MQTLFTENIKNQILEKASSALYYACLYDISFPRSCGLVSMLVTFDIHAIPGLAEHFDIYYCRGHFRDNYYADENFCDDYEEVDRDTADCSNCVDCTCEHMAQHSWIELVHKNSGKTIILDFTSIQFGEFFMDHHETILTTRWTEQSLFEYLINNSEFFISEIHTNFEHYLNTGNRLSSSSIYDFSLKMYKKNVYTEVVEYINYLEKQKKK